MTDLTAPALAQALEDWAAEIDGVAPKGSAAYKLVSDDDAGLLRAAASRLRALGTPTQAERDVERCDSDRPDYPSHPLPSLSLGDPRLSEPPVAASPRAGARLEWQPIETAPTLNDTVIVGLAGSRDMTFGYCHNGSWFCTRTQKLMTNGPTHWMPRPDPPAAVPPAPAPLPKKRTALELEEALYLGAAEAAPLPPQGEQLTQRLLRYRDELIGSGANVSALRSDLLEAAAALASPPTREALTDATLKASNHAYNIASAEYVIKTPEGQYVQAECDAECAAAMRAVLSALPPPATPGEESK